MIIGIRQNFFCYPRRDERTREHSRIHNVGVSRSGTAYKEHSDNWTLVGRHFICASKVEVKFSKRGKMNRQKKIGRIHP